MDIVEETEGRRSVPSRAAKSPAPSAIEFGDDRQERKRHTPRGSSSSRTGTRASSLDGAELGAPRATRSRDYQAIGTLIAPIRRLDAILQDLLNYKVSAIPFTHYFNSSVACKSVCRTEAVGFMARTFP
ncbi:unnamed protein product [Echinostoma caproni]|uniref:Uncharacterized protein n=1 Tax=Echinostoma caproni TaxID=27848 RepID=A0A183BD70_9TREM|nr:unnamed protein product [Echinostoma caproni]